MATAKYISQFESEEQIDGPEYGIVVINKYVSQGHGATHCAPLFLSKNWKSLSGYHITKNVEVTDQEALVCILWSLTYKGWPKDYYEWLGMDGIPGETSEEKALKLIEYTQKIREKTGLR